MSQVQYTRAFREDVKGSLKAHFKLAADGMPLWYEGKKGRHHYYIELRLESPNREKIDKVTYGLNSTYYDPVRPSKDRDNDFAEEITSYGNYIVTVKIQMGNHLYVQEAWLSNLLEDGHANELANESAKGPFHEALKRIKEG